MHPQLSKCVDALDGSTGDLQNLQAFSKTVETLLVKCVILGHFHIQTSSAPYPLINVGGSERTVYVYNKMKLERENAYFGQSVSAFYNSS